MKWELMVMLYVLTILLWAAVFGGDVVIEFMRGDE